MKIIADLHIHSRYARAVSDKMVLPEIGRWAAWKGIDLVGTGDFTHPLWFREIGENLEEAGEGVYKLKSQKAKAKSRLPAPARRRPPLFILQTEIASIYSQGGVGRRVHNLVYAPSIQIVGKINAELAKRGCNLLSDGRPIIGLSSIELCELVFGIDERCLIVPAHIWTPWFSLYGSRSGFDSIGECFGKYAKYIYGIETGLSSDPEMNWRISELEGRAILSSSDAHSGPKLGRETTIFEVEKVSYNEIRKAIKAANYKDKAKPRIAGTIEFYPEEGKYHYTGHRNCKVRYSPEETRRKGTVCPVCGKALTVGVAHRVDELAKKRSGDVVRKVDNHGVEWIFHPKNEQPPYTMSVPLIEIICEIFGGSIYTQTTKNEYNKLTTLLENEFYILLKAPLEDIARISGEKMAVAIRKVRRGDIKVLPGYDGEFGAVKIFSEEEKKDETARREQLGIF